MAPRRARRFGTRHRARGRAHQRVHGVFSSTRSNCSRGCTNWKSSSTRSWPERPAIRERRRCSRSWRRNLWSRPLRWRNPAPNRRQPTSRRMTSSITEIANIYSEEASELLEAAQVSLTGWNRDRNDKDRVAELQRQLHTLKGGRAYGGHCRHGQSEPRTRKPGHQHRQRPGSGRRSCACRDAGQSRRTRAHARFGERRHTARRGHGAPCPDPRTWPRAKFRQAAAASLAPAAVSASAAVPSAVSASIAAPVEHRIGERCAPPVAAGDADVVGTPVTAAAAASSAPIAPHAPGVSSFDDSFDGAAPDDAVPAAAAQSHAAPGAAQSHAPAPAAAPPPALTEGLRQQSGSQHCARIAPAGKVFPRNAWKWRVWTPICWTRC